jgi:aldose 1-epimerase
MAGTSLGRSAQAAVFPSGEQVELVSGEHRAVVVTVGGGLREYVAGARPVLDGYPAGAICDGGRGQLLVPWPNRLRDGRYEWAGTRLQLPLSEPARGNAIHGLARWMRWSVIEHEAARALLGLDLPPQPGFPFQLRLSVEYELDGHGLTVRQSATNIGTSGCPYGAGAHPYLTAGTEFVDQIALCIPAGSRLLTDERQIPTGSVPVDGTPYDFRSPRQLGDAVLDTAFGELERDSEARATVTLRAPDGAEVSLWMDATHRYVMVFTGDTLAEPRRRRGLAVEPMTCAPNAFQSGDGLRVLQPGETFTSVWGISVRR